MQALGMVIYERVEHLEAMEQMIHRVTPSRKKRAVSYQTIDSIAKHIYQTSEIITDRQVLMV